MKKVGFFLILILSWSKLNGQTEPVFPYNHPDKQTLHSLALEGTEKGYNDRTKIVQVINLGLKDTTFCVSDSYIDFIFQHLNLEEVELKEGCYMNSGWNPSLNKMVSSVGHELGWGFQWVFRIGTYSIILIKEDCGNVLTVPVIRTIIQKKEQQVSDTAKSVIQKKEQQVSDTTKSVIDIEINNIINGDTTITERKDTISSLSGSGSLVVVKINNNISFKNPFVPPSDKKERKTNSKFLNWFIPILGAAVLTTAAYLLLKKGPGGAPLAPDGVPGGAPLTPPVTPSDQGGPGGSPLTK